MALDDARATQEDGHAADQLAGCPESIRTRHVSGCAPKLSLDTIVVADEDREPEPPEVVAEASETTRVAPEALIETLREASRSDMPPEPIPSPESAPAQIVVSPAKETREGDDTLIFVLHEESARRPSWIRTVAPFMGVAGLAALTSIFSLKADQPSTPTPRGTEHLNASRARSEQHASPAAAPSPTVVQLFQLQAPAPAFVTPVAGAPEQVALPTVSSDPAVVAASTEEDGEEETQEQRSATRKWMRSLSRGEARLAAQEYESAVISFERAIEYNPSDARSYAGLAQAQFERGRWAEAARAFERAIELSPQDVSLRMGLARAYEREGKSELATSSYRQAMELDPSKAE